jgi:purine/pyrimidine-nucleoside phosphorylase
LLTVNEYFQGNVKSIGLKVDGGKATVGVMVPGDYEFGTSSIEVMKVVTGRLTVKLPTETSWKDFGPGSEFRVDANQKFQLKVAVDTAYLCLYF